MVFNNIIWFITLLQCLLKYSYLLRSLHVHNGDIKIDDWDTKSLSLEDLRKSIGFVPTDPPVFKGSVRFTKNLFLIYDRLRGPLNQIKTPLYASNANPPSKFILDHWCDRTYIWLTLNWEFFHKLPNLYLCLRGCQDKRTF